MAIEYVPIKDATNTTRNVAVDLAPDGTTHTQVTKIDGGGDGGAPALVGGDAANGLDVDVTRSVLPTGAATEATLASRLSEGAPITGQSLEAGGSGALGWLASLRKAITDRLPAALGASGGLKVEEVAAVSSEVTLLTLAARTVDTQSATQTNAAARGVLITVSVTAVPGGAETLQPVLQVWNVAAGSWANYHVFATISGVQGYVYLIYPGVQTTGLTGSLTAAMSLALPRTWRWRMAPSAAGSWTYAVSASLIP